MALIKNIRVLTVDLGNTKPYTIAFKTIDEVLNVFVEIILDDGTSGIGAGCPSEYVTGEHIDQTKGALEEKNLAFLTGRDVNDIKQLTAEVCQRFAATPAACAALDIALHDVYTKHVGIPLVKYLGQKIKSLPTSNTIGIKNVEETLKEAKEYGDRGFSILKVKLGKDLEEDIERLVKLREKFGKQFVIRIDANQGYTFDQTITFFKKTLPLDIELIEQPLPAKEVDQLRKFPDELKRKIAADESLLSPEDAQRLVQPPMAAGIFNVKLMKCGGIRQAIRISDVAAPAGVDLFWGCNDESIVSITAALHAAFSCERTAYIDLDGSLDLGRDIVKGGFILKDGVMSCSERPGLGVERID